MCCIQVRDIEASWLTSRAEECVPTGSSLGSRIQGDEIGRLMVDQEDWKLILNVGDWELTVFTFEDDYSLLTDFELKSPDSDRYLGTIGTPEMVREIIDKPDARLPFWMSDLVLVDELSEVSLIEAVTALIDQGEVERALDFAPPDLEDLMKEDHGDPGAEGE